MWVESICDEPETIEKNIRKAKVNNPDYVGEEPERVVKIIKSREKFKIFKVIQDFLKRIDNYKSAYEPTSKEDYKVFCCDLILLKDF